MEKKFFNLLIVSSLMFLLAILLGAFGAHLFRKVLNKDMLFVYDIGVRYQYYNSIALMIIAMLFKLLNDKNIYVIWIILFFSSILFSGSLYLLAFTNYTIIGIITPIGGIGFIISFIFLIVRLFVLRSRV